MRILHIAKKYPPALGGDAKYVANLERQQVWDGHEVFILTPDLQEIPDKGNIYKFGVKDPSQEWDKITIRRLFSLVLFIFYLPRCYAKLRPEIIHVHSAELGFFASLIGKLFGIPAIITCHCVLFPYKSENFLKRKLELFFLRMGYFRRILTVDSASMSWFEKYRFSNVVFLPECIDLEIYQSEAESYPASLGNEIRLLFVGRLELIKGLDYLLEAMRVLIRLDKKIKLFIVGSGSHAKAFQDMAQSYGLGSQVNFLGPIHDDKALRRMYLESSIFVLPSVMDWCPVVVLEAWALGVAVISTKTGSYAQAATHLKNIYFIPSKDPDSIVDAVLVLLEDEKLRKRIAEGGKMLVEQEFSAKAISAKVSRIYREVIQ